jgi:glycosyltransferase involved in cell wall biosynthesis
MRVSLINLNLVAADAIGQAMLHQVRFHQRRGDEVRVYVMHPPEGLPAKLNEVVRVVDVIDLLGRQDDYFQSSDLYIYHYPGRYALLDTIKTLERGAVVFYYHNVTPPELWGAASGRAELAQGQAAVAKYAAFADLIVTDSLFNAEELQDIHGVAAEQIRVLPLAVPLDRFQPGEADLESVKRYGLAGKEVLLFVGRVAGNKRVDLLVEALAKIKSQHANAVLLVVGDHDSNPAFNEVTAKIRAHAIQLGVEDSVIFTGRVAELPPYYRLASLYVSASLHEGFGVPLIEAMASGVPVVATQAGAQPWVVGDAALLAAPGDAGDLATQILRVLDDDALHGELVQRGLQRAFDFSLEAYHNNWTRILNEVQEWLVERPARPMRLSGPPQVKQGNAVAAELLDLPLQDEIKQLHQAADAVIKPYELRSNVPVLGPLIVWLRRNLTSHLREPYLDPTLRRQERFNWLVVQTMRQVNRLLEPVQNENSQVIALDQRVMQLETQLTGMLEVLAAQLGEIQRADPAASAAALATLQHKIDELRHTSNTAQHSTTQHSTTEHGTTQPGGATLPNDESANTPS